VVEDIDVCGFVDVAQCDLAVEGKSPQSAMILEQQETYHANCHHDGQDDSFDIVDA
jgi:hypothetical protein